MQAPGPEQAASSIDTVVRKCTGFRCLVASGVIFRPLLLFLAYVLSGLLPRAAIILFLRKCSLDSADFVNVKLRNGKHHLLKVQKLSTQPKFVQSKVPITRSKRQFHRVFRLSNQLYIYQPDLCVFLPLDDMPNDLPQQLWSAVTALKGIDNGADWSTFNVPSTWPRTERSNLYGNNDLQLAQPHFLPTLLQAVSFTPYLIQYAELAVSIWHGRLVVSGILVSLTLLSCLRSSGRTYNTRKMLVRTMDQQCLVPFVWAGRIRAVSSRRLVPGDVVVLQRGRACCDMVLLRGACLVEESMLSGEAAKVRKHRYKADYHMASAPYHPDSHQTCTIFAGTIVHQVWNEDDPDDVVLVMVARTGVNSTIGNMLRKALRPASYLSASDSLVQDIFGIYGIAFGLSFVMFLGTVKAKSHVQQYRGTTWARLLDAVVAAIPVGAPTMLIFVVTVTILRLRAQGISVLYPSQLKLAAMVDIACFDKTGTLTGSEEGFHGMLPVYKVAFKPPSKYGIHWGRNLKFAAAVCNGLVMKGKKGCIGDTLEKSIFRAVEAEFLAHNTVALPYRAHGEASYLIKLQILKRFEFTSQAMKSGTIAVAENESDDTAVLFVKGAPSVIQQIADPVTVPPDFTKMVDDWTSQGFRLLALASGTIKHVSQYDIPTLSIQQAEAAVKHMTLLGIIVITNQLRADSRGTIHELQDEGGIRTAMITGDYHQTAISVAWAVGMVPTGGIVHIIDKVARPRTAALSPLTSPVQVASTGMLFPREAGMRPPYSRWQSTVEPSYPFLRPGHAEDGVAQPNHSPREASSSSVGLDKASLMSQMKKLLDSSAKAVQPGWKLQQSAVLADAGSPVARQSTLTALQLPGMSDPPSPQRKVGPEHFRLQCEGLKFTLGFGDVREDIEAINAMTSIAEGDAQCAITGAAFEHLLQQEDLSVLETVLQNAVVFARMRPHQKAQVLCLLGGAGLHQVFQGRHRHIPGLGQTAAFCGDGLNDLAALVTAEVGLAIGPLDAMVAAPVSTRKSSIAGFSTLIKEARASHVKIIVLVKWCVLYQLVQFMATCVVFAQKGIFISQLQLGIIDLQSLLWGFAASLTPPAVLLSPTKPTFKLCSKPIIKPILECLVGAAVLQSCCIVLMKAELHVTAGSIITTTMNPAVTLAWTVANFVLQGQIAGFRVDTYPHCSGLTSNSFLIAASVIIMLFAHACVMAGPWLNHKPLMLFPFPLHFRVLFYAILLGAAGLFFTARSVRWYANSLHQRRMRTLLITCGSRQLSSTRNSLGSGEVAQPFKFGLTQLVSKLSSIRVRSPRIHPAPVELSALSRLSRQSEPKVIVHYPPLQTFSTREFTAVTKGRHGTERSEV